MIPLRRRIARARTRVSGPACVGNGLSPPERDQGQGARAMLARRLEKAVYLVGLALLGWEAIVFLRLFMVVSIGFGIFGWAPARAQTQPQIQTLGSPRVYCYNRRSGRFLH